ncbi:G-type lectin S-receptor-like serine/threonine-protein kinase At5g35370 isoform X2 [Panicum virgatum]|uniref:G-type lectin S-receptor-like serine/threonine-protein kinase At5g35370 isoform X2 n=1 Tax=Panicum virgatum TaxID=38727 RepID=UPI0019D5F9E1|nr:G-type lectin S-receptor-like serine/threonine-protein kinase At5g35370 isoform X2 [Panicum virgatum]
MGASAPPPPPPPPPRRRPTNASAPPRALAFLGLVLVALSACGAVAGPLATELVRPSFVASNILYVDTGGAFLEPKSGAFRAAVVNPGKQQGRFYLAVLHAPSATVFWSANRGAPTTSSGPVQLTAQGLTVSDPNGKVLWSTPSQLGSPVSALRLQDSGNLQLLGAGNATLWQSFDAATDTLLPGQQLHADPYLAAAASATDLAEGDYRLAATAADVVLTWQGSTYWRLSNDLQSFKDRNVAVASVSVNASGLFAVAADGGLVFRVDLAAGVFPVLKLGYDGRLRNTGYPLVNSSASLGGDFVAPANDCDLPLQCLPLGLCSPIGDGVCKSSKTILLLASSMPSWTGVKSFMRKCKDHWSSS